MLRDCILNIKDIFTQITTPISLTPNGSQECVETSNGTYESNESNMTAHVNDPVMVTVMNEVDPMDGGKWVTVESRKRPKRIS
jgi:hypothetical protein